MHGRIQEQLEGIYRVDRLIDVDHFIVPWSVLAQRKDPLSKALKGRDEQILLRQGEEHLEISLVLADHVLAQTRGAPLALGMTPRLFPGFCAVAEGVSHLVHLAWCAARRRPVRPLELELQAEVDKYAVLLFSLPLPHRQKSETLLSRLFERFTLADDLTPEERSRYLEANQRAYRYCRFLHRSYVQHDDQESMLRDLRRFYRLDGAHKLTYAADCSA